MNIQPLLEGRYFHIYNRGVNGENLFKNEAGYRFFLEQYRFYCSGVFETHSYCLLKNHFHFLVFVKKDPEEPRRNGNGMFRRDASRQLGHMFNSFAQKVNRAHQRTGPLFESPFERKEVDDDAYLVNIVRYCHLNPVHHGFVSDCRDWEYSSYHEILGNKSEWIESGKVLERFGGVAGFEKAHREITADPCWDRYAIEYSASTTGITPPSGIHRRQGAFGTADGV